MRKTLFTTALMLSLGGLVSACQNQTTAQVPAQAQVSEQQQLVEKAKVSIEALRSDATMGRPINDNLAKARAVMVFPNLVKAGFFFGAGGGQGVLLVREGRGWSDPVFVYAADASFGLQIGVEGGQVMFTIMNDGALQKLLNGNVDLGGDVSVAVGPAGVGAQGATTPNVGADLLAFSLQQGAFAGAAFKGGVVAPRKEWNDAYYGPGVQPAQIIQASRRGGNPELRGLKLALENRGSQTSSTR